MNVLAQIAVITWLNIKNIPQRWGISLVAIVGAGGVVAVLVAVLAMSVGFAKTLAVAGNENRAVILRGGATTELASGLDREAIDIIQTAPGIAKKNGRPIVAPLLMVILDAPMRATGTSANIPFRGVTAELYDVLDQFKIMSGRRPEPGKREIIVGRSAHRQFAGLDVGATVGSGTNTWSVVGIFSENGSVRESEVWADATVVQDAYRRGNTFNSVLVALDSPASLKMIASALEKDPRLDISVQRETDYFAAQADELKTFIDVMGYSVALIMAIGAIFASLNTMYSAISVRSREIGTLRALGFGAFPVLVSVLVEAILLTLGGGLIGGTLAYLIFNGFTVSTLNFASFSQVAFAFVVSPALFAMGLGWAVLIGLIGGFFPALRAARAPVTEALREL